MYCSSFSLPLSLFVVVLVQPLGPCHQPLATGQPQLTMSTWANIIPVTTSSAGTGMPAAALPVLLGQPLVSTGQQGLAISPTEEPFSNKLVEKIHSGQFVDRKELLADNRALLQQLESVHGVSPFGSRQPASNAFGIQPHGASASWGISLYAPMIP